LEKINPSVSCARGEVLKNKAPLEILIYPFSTLERVCQDGLTYLEHLTAELKLHQHLQSQEHWLFRNLAVFEN